MFRIAICEDEPVQMAAILNLLKSYQNKRPGLDLQIESFEDGEHLLKSIDTGSQFDLFLLDILIPGIDGIELAKTLRRMDKNVTIAFLTSSQDYALDAFRVFAVQYLLKPIRENDLFPVLDSVVKALAREGEKFFMFSMPERIVKIQFSSVICVELFNRTLKFYLDNGRILQSRMIRMPFAKAIAPLLEDPRFLHAHKSFVINMDYVEELSNGGFVMKGGIEMPVPKYKYAKAKAIYFGWISKR